MEITKLPAGPIDPDLYFDRWQHDDAGVSSSADRSEALAHKDFGRDLFSTAGRRSAPKRRSE